MRSSSRKFLLSKSSSSSLTSDGSIKKAKFKSIILQNTRGSVKKTECRVVKVAKENTVSYEEFLNILQKPNIFIIKWFSNTGCCNRKQTFSHFEITNIAGSPLLKGKYSNDSVRVFDDRNKLFMMLDYTKDKNRKAVLTVPNSTIPLATMEKLTNYMPHNERFQMVSEHFSELNCNVEQQTLPSRYSGSLYKYTITSGKNVLSKVLQPSTGDPVYVLVDEDVSVFQKTGILAASIFISQRPIKSVRKLAIVSLIFVIVFILGFVVVASTVFDLRYKENEGPKFPNKLKAGEDAT